MEKQQYATQFFSLLLDGIQDLCRTNLDFERFAEVTGYISVELDNAKKERYVLNEIVQSSGRLVSESFCTKSFTTQTEYEAPSVSFQKPHRDQFIRYTNDVKIGNQSSQCFQFPSRYSEQSNSGASFLRTNQERSASSTRQRQFRHPARSSSISPYESDSDYGGQTSHHGSTSRTKFTDREYESNDSIIELDNDEDADVESSDEVARSHGLKPGQMHQFRNQYSDRVSLPSLPPDMNNQSSSNPLLEETSPSFTTSQAYEQSRSTSSHWQPTHQSSKSKQNISHELGQEVIPGTMRSLNEVNVKPKPESLQKVQRMSDDVDIKPKVEPMTVLPSNVDGDEVIDLDMFEDDIDSLSTTTEDQCNQDSTAESVLPESSPQRVRTSGHNPSIRNVVKYAVNQFRRYHFLKSKTDIDLFTVPPERLDMLLYEFFKGVRKADGSEMNIQTLKNFQSHIDRYLREGGYPHSLVKDHKFQMSRDWIKKRFLEEGRGRRNPARHTPLSDYEIDILFQSQQLGSHSADSLINTMWFMNTKYFGIRNLSEHFNLKWGDVVLEWDSQGQEYLVCPLKTIQQFSPKVFPNVENPSRCFVSCYKVYAELRPEGGLDIDSYFYLSSQKSSQLCNKESACFSLEQLSWNRLSFLWRKMVAAAGLPPDRKVKSNWNV